MVGGVKTPVIKTVTTISPGKVIVNTMNELIVVGKDDLKQLMTVSEAAQALHVHPNTLRNWEKEGKFKSVRIGTRRDRRYPKKFILALAETKQ
jgi:excisionase family DNA binding protein